MDVKDLGLVTKIHIIIGRNIIASNFSFTFGFRNKNVSPVEKAHLHCLHSYNNNSDIWAYFNY